MNERKKIEIQRLRSSIGKWQAANLTEILNTVVSPWKITLSTTLEIRNSKIEDAAYINTYIRSGIQEAKLLRANSHDLTAIEAKKNVAFLTGKYFALPLFVAKLETYKDKECNPYFYGFNLRKDDLVLRAEFVYEDQVIAAWSFIMILAYIESHFRVKRVFVKHITETYELAALRFVGFKEVNLIDKYGHLQGITSGFRILLNNYVKKRAASMSTFRIKPSCQ